MFFVFWHIVTYVDGGSNVKWIGRLVVMVFMLGSLVGCTQTITVDPQEASSQLTSGQQLTSIDAASTRRMAMRTSESAVKVINPYRGRGSGTYFEVNKHHIIVTAAHVVSDTQYAFVEGRDGETALGSIFYRDERRDIALILIPKLESRESMRYRPLSEQEMRGTEVIYTGFPASHDLFTAYGRISGLSQNNNLLMHSYAWMGASGSGVFDMRGRMVGVLIAVDLGSSPYDPYRVLPPHVVEDVVRVVPIWDLDMEQALESIECYAEGDCQQE